MGYELPAWAAEMREVFRSGTTSQFVLFGSVFDLVPADDGKGGRTYMALRQFLTEVMFAPFEVVIHFDRGKGLRLRKGGDHFHRFLKAFDTFQGTSWAGLPDVGPDKMETLDLGNLLPRDPKRAFELIDRFLRGALARTRLVEGKPVPDPLKVAVIVDYAQFIAPQGEPSYIADLSQTLIQLVDWAADPAITGSFVATVLITENLADLNRVLVENPYSAKIEITLPRTEELGEFVGDITAGVKDFDAVCEVPRETLAGRLVGLSRVNVRNLLQRAITSRQKITGKYLTRLKKEIIEKEAFGRLEFLETDRTLDDVAGHAEAKAWLRQDTVLLRKGRTLAIPMGYLLTGRIGTGKTFLVECLAGEIGIPCVELKNFREKWVGATEGNLEKVFGILHALGQVIVFVDEADQAMGKRGGGDGDSGLSGRIYAMMAKEMSDTRNRGKIIWIFATSRPDLLEVDLKRQGRLDVHIPLFPPGDTEGRKALLLAMARKLKVELKPEEVPALPEGVELGGNEMEGILVRALRVYETQPEDQPRRPFPEVVAEVLEDIRPSAHTERLELMDLLAVKECTDTRFLPERFRAVPSAEVNRRIAALKLSVGE
ncbi:MAG TPA: ATP-binding protein [Thermoanaerobaculaceae bacterium]|nr:ATP-binding protein [Thermoanaerobaculaceae bacterium]HPS77084.1 ATP-binding protein [Thermoanaerobaculaceae bacterium]